MLASEFQVRLHALNFGVADVATIEEGKEIEDCEHGDQADVHFAEGLLGVDVGGVNSISGPVGIMDILGCLGDMLEVVASQRERILGDTYLIMMNKFIVRNNDLLTVGFGRSVLALTFD